MRMNPREKAGLRDGVRSRKWCASNSSGHQWSYRHQSNSPLYKLVGASQYKKNFHGTRETRMDKGLAMENNEEKESSGN